MLLSKRRVSRALVYLELYCGLHLLQLPLSLLHLPVRNLLPDDLCTLIGIFLTSLIVDECISAKCARSARSASPTQDSYRKTSQCSLACSLKDWALC